jgi:TPR repeat protein
MKKAILIFSIIIISCTNKKTEKKHIPFYMKTQYFPFNSYMSDKFSAVEKGDEEAYKRLGLFYSYNPNLSYEYLSISIIMAEKHRVKRGYHEVYYSIVKIYNNGIYTSYNFKNLNKEQKALALYYLEKGVQNKEMGCFVELARIYRYGIGIEKNMKKAVDLERYITNDDKYYDIMKSDEIELNIER